MKTVLVFLLLLLLTLTGCAAYRSLIGHPISVLIRQHHDNEASNTNVPAQ